MAELTGLFGAYLWPFFRIGALVLAAPLFSSQFISVRARLGLALVISLVVVPTISAPVPSVDPLSADGILLVITQLLIGLCMGFMLQLLFNAFILAGQIIAMQMGLGFASMVDPQNGMTVPVISQFYLIFVTLVFLAIDGHLILIRVIAESFSVLPIATTGLPVQAFRDVVALGSWMYAASIIIALPAIGSLMLVNLAFGVLSRAAPQISPFSIGFPMTILLGFLIMLITLPNVGSHFVAFSDEMLQLARQMVTPDG